MPRPIAKPTGWKRLERNIMLRADFRCECGTGWDCQTNAHHRRCPNVSGQRYPHNKRMIALRVVQVGPLDDWRPTNLLALCLPCFLRWEALQAATKEEGPEDDLFSHLA